MQFYIFQVDVLDSFSGHEYHDEGASETLQYMESFFGSDAFSSIPTTRETLQYKDSFFDSDAFSSIPTKVLYSILDFMFWYLGIRWAAKRYRIV